MNISRLSPIDWLSAMDRLSVGAFYLLNVIYRKDIDISDENLMNITGYGISTHRKQKKELLDCNYLTIEQVGKGTYQYTVKDINVK
jgi:hypothetical protein